MASTHSESTGAKVRSLFTWGKIPRRQKGASMMDILCKISGLVLRDATATSNDNSQ